MAVKRVLSIDGGGIRGIIPGLIVQELEEKTGRSACEMFDLIAGTSTGGLLALGLTCPRTREGADRAYTAEELVSLYIEEGPTIFPRSPWQRFKKLGNVLEEKYDAEPIENVLRDYFGDCRLRDARTDVLVTSYAIERRDVHFFKSTKAVADPDERDVEMWKAARATSAAPTYFEPVKISVGDDGDYYSLIDGGVYSNNPAMCAYVEAKTLWPGDDIYVVSLGTGELIRQIAHEEATGWGLAGWAQPILDVVFDGVADTTDYHLQTLLNGGSDSRYVRLQMPLTEGSDDLDDASRSNMRLLRLHAEKVLDEQQDRFEKMCEWLP